MTTATKEKQSAVPTLNPEAAIAKFNVTDAAIAKMKKEYMRLTIAGLDDREGYKAVHEARMDVKSKRVEVDKLRKDLNADALAYQRAVNGEAKRITELLTPIEEHLTSEEKKIDDEKARLKAEAERKEQEKLQGRVAKLVGLGCHFDGEKYVLGASKATVTDIKQASDETFNNFLNAVQAEADQIAKQKAEEEAARKAEEERLAAERAQLEKQRKEQEAKEAELRRQQEEIERKKREAEEAERKAKEEKERAEREEQERKDAEARAKKLAEEVARQEEEARLKKEAADKAEAARQEALRPDKDKLLSFGNTLGTLTIPEVKTTEGKELADWIKAELVRIQKGIVKRAAEL